MAEPDVCDAGQTDAREEVAFGEIGIDAEQLHILV
jgi:hypothetical protein